jgi:hypothetical protein
VNETPEGLVEQYYRTVNFDESPFDPAGWAAWLADDYTYVAPDGAPHLGKETAVRYVTADFAAYSSVRCAPHVLVVKRHHAEFFSTLIRMVIAAAGKDGKSLSLTSTVLLAFRKGVDRWLVTDEVAVLRQGGSRGD